MKIPEPVGEQPHPLSEFFDYLRGHRLQERAEPGDVRKSAVITMVHNESVFLPIWLDYYSRFFARRDIFVFDNDTTDGSTRAQAKRCILMPVHRDRVDHTWMVQTIQTLQHQLLEHYDNVLVTDVDEIVVPSPGRGDLGEYLAGFKEGYVSCLGYELIHMRDREPAYVPGVPVLDQRGYWFPNDTYDKPILASMPMDWQPGFHRTNWEETKLDPDLRLVHLHRLDYELCKERHRLRSRRRWEQGDVDSGWAVHNRVAEDEAFDEWFYTDGDHDRDLVVEGIPAEWKGRF